MYIKDNINKYWKLDSPKAEYLEVEVGDSKDTSKFQPQVKLMKWDNETNFSIRYIDNDQEEPTITSENDDTLVKYSKSKFDVLLYEKDLDEEGAYEIEVLLKEKPSSNVITFSIETKDFNFFKQNELTENELSRDATRPENVIGSYAVYHTSKKNNKYKAGKAFHIFRPKIIDANGDWTWAELNIDVNKKELTVTIPQDFLDTKVYPILVDPTVGYTTSGASTLSINGYIQMEHGTTTQTGYFGTIFARLTISTSPAKIRAAVYSDDTGADAILMGSYERDWVNATGPFNLAFQRYGASVAVSDATKYYIAVWGEEVGTGAGTVLIYYDGTGDTDDSYLAQTYSSNNGTTGWPDPISGVSQEAATYTIYAEYELDESIYVGTQEAGQAMETLKGPYWTDKDTGMIITVSETNTGAWLMAHKTTDAGVSWTPIEIVSIGNSYTVSPQIKGLATFFDQELPDDTGTLIHMAWYTLDGANSYLYYRTIDISDGSLGTLRTLSTTLTVNATNYLNTLALTKALSGYLYVGGTTQTDNLAYVSTDSGANWSTIATFMEDVSAEDWAILLPANTGDNNDICCLFWDRSSNTMSIKMYDNSANSWTETNIDTAATDDLANPNMDAAVRHSDNHIILAFHNNDDSTTDDLKVYDITPDSIASPTVTGLTDVFTNTGEAAQVAVMINQQNNYIYVAYIIGGTWTTWVSIYYSYSTDGGSTWQTPVRYSLTNNSEDYQVVSLGRTVGNDGGRFMPVWGDYRAEYGIYTNTTNDIEIDVYVPPSSAIKTINGLAIASVKTVNGLAIASVKTWNGLA